MTTWLPLPCSFRARFSVHRHAFAKNRPWSGVSANVRLVLSILVASTTVLWAAALDFSAGFQEMSRLGVPDTAGAKWVGLKEPPGDALGRMLAQTAPPLLESGDEDEEEADEGGAGAARVVGRAWLLPPVDGAPARVVADQSTLVRAFAGPDADALRERFDELVQKVRASKDPAERRALGREQMALVRGWTLAEWEPADVAADVAAVEAAILKLRQGGGNDDTDVRALMSRLSGKAAPAPDESGLKRLPAESLAERGGVTYFLFACHLWRAGEREHANRLATALFAAVDEPQAFLDKVVASLATAELNHASEALFTATTPDWAAYITALEAIRDRYTRGWKEAPGVPLLIARAKDRLAAPPVTLALEGVTFSQEETALARRLADSSAAPAAPPEDYYDEAPITDTSALWLVSPPAEAKDPVDAIKALGLRGVAIFAGMLGQELPVPTAAVDRRSRYTFSSFGGAEDEAQLSPEAAVKELTRPATLHALAMTHLSQVLPPSADEGEARASILNRGSGPSAADEAARMRPVALAFLKQHEKATRRDLLTAYLKDGSPSQRPLALRAMLLEAEPDTALIEEHFLATLAESDLQLVGEYIQKRKSKAGDFLTAYKKAFKDKAANSEERRYTAEQLDQWFERLASLTSGKDAAALLLDLRNGTPLAKIQTALNTALAEMPAIDAVDALATAAAETDDPYLAASHFDRMLRAPKREASLADVIVATPERKARWEKLVSDTRPVPHPLYNTFGPTVGTGAATTLEFLCSAPDERDEALQSAFALRGSDAAKNPFLPRARARLAGQPLPEWPFQAKVATERKQALLAEAAAKPAGEVAGWFGALPASEQLFLLTEGAQADAPPGWLEASLTVSRVEVGNPTWNDAFPWQSLHGKKLDRALMEKLLAALKEKPLPPGAVYIEPSPDATALAVFLETPGPQQLETFRGSAGRGIMDVMSYSGRSDRERYVFPLPPDPAAAVKSAPPAGKTGEEEEGEEEEEEQEDTGDPEKALALIDAASASKRTGPLYIRITAIPAGALPEPPKAPEKAATGE